MRLSPWLAAFKEHAPGGTFVSCWLTVLLALATPPLLADTDLRIAAASDLKFAFDEIGDAFREAHPEAGLDIIYGSSGKFRTQVAHGAPFDLYFSADIAYPEALAADGHAASEVVLYAVGRIVLWSSRLDASGMRLEDLGDKDIRRIAIANPRHAPYGARAREALENAGVWAQLQDRLVFGENIAHAAQFVQSGAAEVGIIALALALNPRLREAGDFWLIPEALHEPLKQGFIVTRRGEDNELAWAFAEFMASETAQAIMREHGFVLPGEAPWSPEAGQ